MLLSLPFTLASTAAFSPSRVLVAHSLPIHPRVGPVKMQRLTNLEECVLSVPLGDVPECMRLMDEAMEKKPDPPALSRDGYEFYGAVACHVKLWKQYRYAHFLSHRPE